MKSKKYILLIVNPIAGNSKKNEIISSVEKEAAKRNYGFKLYKTSGDNDKVKIVAIIKENEPVRVLVAGGDGTISMAAECILGTSMCLGIIPAGSANGMAVNLNLPETLPEQIEVALSDCTMQIDALFINDTLCLHIADMGINAELIKNYENSGVRGKFGYFLQSIPTLFNSESPFHFTIETEEGTVEKSGVLLAIANANKFGTGATINPHGKINDGKFEILVFKNLDVIEIFKTIQDKPEMSSDFVHTISTHKAKIVTKKEVPFQIDGEFMGEIKSINAKIGNKKLILAVPKLFCKPHNQSNNL